MEKLHNGGRWAVKRDRADSRKGRSFWKVFLPAGLGVLLLEILTLLVCIVVFAPLSQLVSNLFIVGIALTALLLLLVPLIHGFVCHYQGDKAEHEERLAQEKQAAVRGDYLVLETDSVRRKQYLRFPKLLFLTVCPGCLLVSLLGLYLTRDIQQTAAILALRQLFLALAAIGMFSFIPLLIYWANCSGTSKVQRIYLSQNQLFYTGYSGSMEERVEFTFTLTGLESYRVGKRTIWIRGQFRKKTKDFYGTRQRELFPKTLWIPRTFPLKQEQILLEFLRRQRRS